MTISHFPGERLGPTDDDRDIAIERLSLYAAAPADNLLSLEREIAFRDAAIDFGSLLQHLVPAGERREQAWIMLEDAYLRGIQAITAPTHPMEA